MVDTVASQIRLQHEILRSEGCEMREVWLSPEAYDLYLSETRGHCTYLDWPVLRCPPLGYASAPDVLCQGSERNLMARVKYWCKVWSS